MVRGFNVESIEIEGFKGFTSPQSIDFGGRHVFLLGPNGNGKSSIIEAVRWGLFGSTFRPNEVVKNQHYSRECRVAVKLVRSGELWDLRRTLNLGAGSTSNAVLTDQHGQIRRLREVMPQLDSVDAGEGTHIIFSSQSAPLSKQPEDLEPFERTVFNYLRLTHPRVLLSTLDDFVKSQSDVEDKLGQELTDTRTEIDNLIAYEKSIRSAITTAPPWGTEQVPTVQMSERKVRNFISEVSDRSPDDELQGLSLDALLENADKSLEKKRIESQESLIGQADQLAGRRVKLEDLRHIRSQIVAQESIIDNSRSELEDVLNGVTHDELQRTLNDTKFNAATESIKVSILQSAIDLIKRSDSEEIFCPVCNSQHSREDLESSLHDATHDHRDLRNETITQLEYRLQQARNFDSSVKTGEAKLRRLRTDEGKAIGNLDDEDKIHLSNSDDISIIIDRYSLLESDIRSQINNQTEWHNTKLAELNRLKEESRFHQVQRKLRDLEIRRQEFDVIAAAYHALVAFGQSIRAIKMAVESTFNQQLAQDIPRVSEILSTAFSALAQHTYYDKLVIDEVGLPKLKLMVASSHDPTGKSDRLGVLNGQAESAVAVAPYFAFSQADDTPTEVYLVMLDDPTRALDTAHIHILLERLRELGRNVQLIVASQETERFHDMIPEIFDDDSYVIIEPTGWSPDDGPKLKIYE